VWKKSFLFTATCGIWWNNCLPPCPHCPCDMCHSYGSTYVWPNVTAEWAALLHNILVLNLSLENGCPEAN
jgi:hypothetical protein